jgi:hypothetical protein
MLGTEHSLEYILVELGYNIMKGTDYFLLLKTSVVITEKNNVMVKSEKLIGASEYMTL